MRSELVNINGKQIGIEPVDHDYADVYSEGICIGTIESVVPGQYVAHSYLGAKADCNSQAEAALALLNFHLAESKEAF